jgi:hypothetical protein
VTGPGRPLTCAPRSSCPTWPAVIAPEREVRNVLDGLQDLHDRIVARENIEITPKLIRDFNQRILEGTQYRDGVVPGEFRTESVVVGGYRAAPSEDCEYLVDRLVEWLNGPTFG